MMENEHAHLNQISNQTETEINEEEKIQEVEPEEPSAKILEPKEEPEKVNVVFFLSFGQKDTPSVVFFSQEKKNFLRYFLKKEVDYFQKINCLSFLSRLIPLFYVSVYQMVLA